MSISGDFADLYAESQPAVARMLSRYVGEDAEDVMQDAALAAWRGFSSWRRSSSFGTWLYAIARRCAIAHKAKARPVADVELDYLEGCYIDQASLVGLERAISAVPDAYRESLILCDVGGLTYEQVAQATGADVGTVRSRIKRGRAAVLERL
jgi:RNA polymerase sigma factor (sigma-70 family)